MTDPGSELTAGLSGEGLCPECGDELHLSALYPHGRDSGGAIRKAKVCLEQNLSFGLASDGTWSIPVVPINLNDHVAGPQRNKRQRKPGAEGLDSK
jgi:hypothetical protein